MEADHPSHLNHTHHHSEKLAEVAQVALGTEALTIMLTVKETTYNSVEYNRKINVEPVDQNSPPRLNNALKAF
jgi:hypothetical protein